MAFNVDKVNRGRNVSIHPRYLPRVLFYLHEQSAGIEVSTDRGATSNTSDASKRDEESTSEEKRIISLSAALIFGQLCGTATRIPRLKELIHTRLTCIVRTRQGLVPHRIHGWVKRL